MNEADDDAFLAAFESCAIPKAEWTHQAHVRMAWLYLRRLGLEEAILKIRSGIQKYNAAVGGAPNGYHETVTQVYTRLVYDCLSRRGGREKSWGEFVSGFPELFDRQNPPSLKYYRKETLSSDEARARFVEPDLQPLPS